MTRLMQSRNQINKLFHDCVIAFHGTITKFSLVLYRVSSSLEDPDESFHFYFLPSQVR